MRNGDRYKTGMFPKLPSSTMSPTSPPQEPNGPGFQPTQGGQATTIPYVSLLVVVLLTGLGAGFLFGLVTAIELTS